MKKKMFKLMLSAICNRKIVREHVNINAPIYQLPAKRGSMHNIINKDL